MQLRYKKMTSVFSFKSSMIEAYFVWFKFLEVLYATWEGTFLQLFLGFWAYCLLIEMLIKFKQAMSRRSTVVSTSLTKSVLLTIAVRSAICCCYIGM
jgi:hypothetical protein